MCNFFSCIVTKAGEVLFTESESHETIISRSGLKDDLGYFVRVEYTPKAGYRVDEASIPEWYERIAAKAKRDVVTTYKKIAPSLDEYEKVQQSAWDEYEKVQQSAWDEYKKVQQSALDEYEKVKQPAWDEYKNAILKVHGYLHQEVKEVSE